MPETFTTRAAFDAGFGRGGVLVPTMGALHAGHTSLIGAARAIADELPGCPGVVATVFVNPTQFNDPSDLARYPRDPDADAAMAFAAGADAVFAPDTDEVYPPGVEIEAPELPRIAEGVGLEDGARPGFLRGVGQVVNRLFTLTRPAAAIFGEKDWQQLLFIEFLARERHPGLQIVRAPTIRELDGLAMASRNRLLSDDERRRAEAVPRALEAACAERDPAEAEQEAAGVIARGGLEMEYTTIRDAETCGPVRADRPARVFIAARAGKTRLIDNHPWEAGCDLRVVAAQQREG
ncbi:MAG: pantoate--beta-alanine ligase [Planctomycetota bacterium]